MNQISEQKRQIRSLFDYTLFFHTTLTLEYQLFVIHAGRFDTFRTLLSLTFDSAPPSSLFCSTVVVVDASGVGTEAGVAAWFGLTQYGLAVPTGGDQAPSDARMYEKSIEGKIKKILQGSVFHYE